MSNDPEKMANQLLQCLTQDKKPLGFLVGAGCPCSIKDGSGSPLIPDIRGITETVANEICSKELKEPWKTVCLQLTEDGNPKPNIEDILSRVRSLRDLAGGGEIRGLTKASLEEVEKRICDEIIKCVSKDLPNKSTAYHNFASWITSIDRTHPVEVFTTNYDLLMEQAFEDIRAPFFDGFVGARQPFFDGHAIEFDDLPRRWAKLWKIHGSINWRSAITADGFKVWRTDVEKGGNVVIHPSHLKYDQSRKMPYLTMMDRLKKFVTTPSSALIVIGYSFGDQHINDVIVQGLQGTPTAVVFALMYEDLGQYASATQLGKERGNLFVLARDGAVAGTKEQVWKKSEEKPDSVLPSGAVLWSKGSKNDDPWFATFGLGDFNCFGAFLQDISGKGI